MQLVSYVLWLLTSVEKWLFSGDLVFLTYSIVHALEGEGSSLSIFF